MKDEEKINIKKPITFSYRPGAESTVKSRIEEKHGKITKRYRGKNGKEERNSKKKKKSITI